MSKPTTNLKLKAKYVSKLVINGQVVPHHSKQVITKIKNIEVTLNCTFISELELKDAYISNFNLKHQGKDIEVIYCKVGSKVSATLYINNVLAFSSLSMQAVFTVLHTAYGISKNSLNSLYIKSNTTRKQQNSSMHKIVIDSSFEF